MYIKASNKNALIFSGRLDTQYDLINITFISEKIDEEM